ncbi:MAG TPA: hypothetical protein VHY82_03885 [Acetobacteraceae bacterium]|nr:hypothetical protein [Acetobacteraceae bacterium]
MSTRERVAIFFAQAVRSRRGLAIELRQRCFQARLPSHADLVFDGVLLRQARQRQERAQRKPLDQQGAKHDDERTELDEIAVGKSSGSAKAVARVTMPRIPHQPTTMAPAAVGLVISDCAPAVQQPGPQPDDTVVGERLRQSNQGRSKACIQSKSYRP